MLCDVGHAVALRQVLANQPVGVLVGAAFPGMVRVGEVDGHAGGRFDLRVVMKLCSVGGGNGLEPLWVSLNQPDGSRGDDFLGLSNSAPRAPPSTYSSNEMKRWTTCGALEGRAVPFAFTFSATRPCPQAYAKQQRTTCFSQPIRRALYRSGRGSFPMRGVSSNYARAVRHASSRARRDCRRAAAQRER